MPQEEQERKTRAADRFYPCLMVQLIDSNPQVKTEGMLQVFSAEQVRADVMRNLEMILNSRSHISKDVLNNYSYVRKSVQNFGMSDFCGKSVTTEVTDQIRSEMLEQIHCFEPRIDSTSLNVEIDDKKIRKQEQALKISGIIRIKPLNEEIQFISRLDFETGNIKLISG